MSSEIPSGATDRAFRSVWPLVLVVLLVFGLAVGGTLRTAFAMFEAAPPLPSLAVADVHASALKPVAQVVPIVASVTVAPVTVNPVTVAVVTPAVAAVVPTLSRQGWALPAHSGIGQRIVYQESKMHLWVVDADGTVLRDYAVTGRPGWPRAGTYHVLSKVAATVSPKYGVTFRYMVRFAKGHTLMIGFHDIPRKTGSGVPIQSEANLGAPIGHGGCVRQRTEDAKWLFTWASVGTTVIVLR